MASNSDHFPSSLPNFDTPKSVHSHLPASDSSNQADFFDSAFPFDSAEHSPSNHDLSDFAYRSHPSTEPKNGRSPMSSAFQDLSFSLSPESSPPDSSSDSSVQHQRKGSSNSSHSGLLGGDVAMVDDDQVAAWSAAEGMAGIQSSTNLGSSILPSIIDFDFSNSTMDKVFDFDSAASSPGPHTDSNILDNSSLKNVKMPYRSSPKSVLARGRAPGHRSTASAVRRPFPSTRARVSASHIFWKRGIKPFGFRDRMRYLRFLLHIGTKKLCLPLMHVQQWLISKQNCPTRS